MSATDAIIKSAVVALSTSSLDKFHTQLKRFSRSDCHSDALRHAVYARGVMASALAVLSKEVDIASLDPFHVSGDADELSEQRLAFVQQVAAEAEIVREKAAETAAALRKAEDEALASGVALATCWRKGTGYGFDDGDEYWDDDYSSAATVSVRSTAVLAKRARVDSHIESCLRFLIATLEPCQTTMSDEVRDSAVLVLSASCLVPLLASLLRQGELLYEENPSLYKQAVRCTRLFARVPGFAVLLGPLSKLPIRDTIASLLKTQLEDLTDAKALAAEVEVTDAPEGDATAKMTEFEDYLTSTTELVLAAAPSPTTVSTTASASITEVDAEESKAEPTATETDKAVEAEAKVEDADDDDDKSTTSASTDSSSSPAPATGPAAGTSKALTKMLTDMEEEYAKKMSRHQFGSRAMNSGSTSAGGAGGGSGDASTYIHKYASALTAEASGSGASGRLPRVMKELRSLRRSLPLNAGSSVFLRYDKARPYMMQALITGPSGTPYDSACLLFDLYCGETYPNNSPKINLMTTGGGTWRAGPNLYNCGKVCLSLLGTWGGSSEESWTKDSTLLQLFVSIQSLILVEEPYFNEPSCERSKGTPSGDTQSRSCSNGGYEPTRLRSIQWGVVDMLRHPPAGFEDIVRDHFKLKSDYLNRVADEWLADASDATKSQLKAQVLEMRKELALLHTSKPIASISILPPGPPALVRASSG